MPLIDIILIIIAYLFGSLSTAVVVCKIMRLPDPRAEGSGNPGATNVMRLGGKKAAGITLFGDMLKGLLPVLLTPFFSESDLTLALVGGAAFLGHLFPIFFSFKGGKGVATELGVLLGFTWWGGLACLITWLVIARLIRISSVAGLTSALLAPLYVWWFYPYASPALITATVFMTVLLIWRHRSNIQNLLQGTEGRIKSKS